MSRVVPACERTDARRLWCKLTLRGTLSKMFLPAQFRVVPLDILYT